MRKEAIFVCSSPRGCGPCMCLIMDARVLSSLVSLKHLSRLALDALTQLNGFFGCVCITISCLCLCHAGGDVSGRQIYGIMLKRQYRCHLPRHQFVRPVACKSHCDQPQDLHCLPPHQRLSGCGLQTRSPSGPVGAVCSQFSQWASDC